jgi:hypothetical protein
MLCSISYGMLVISASSADGYEDTGWVSYSVPLSLPHVTTGSLSNIMIHVYIN